MSCGSIWRCFCEQSNEPESKDPQHRKAEEYSGAGHSAELYVQAFAGLLHGIQHPDLQCLFEVCCTGGHHRIFHPIDEVFIDVTDYLNTYKLSPHDLAMKIILDVLETTGITATAGIGTNLFLCKVAIWCFLH